MCKPYKGFDQRFYLTDYNVPTVLSIGRVYQTLILNVMDLYENVIEAIKKVYSSFISEEISMATIGFAMPLPWDIRMIGKPVCAPSGRKM